jgi:hypothetical protein
MAADRPAHSIWWLHAVAFSWYASLQALWIGLQLRYTLHQSWAGVFVPMYLLALYWMCYCVWLWTIRARHRTPRDPSRPYSTPMQLSDQFYWNRDCDHDHAEGGPAGRPGLAGPLDDTTCTWLGRGMDAHMLLRLLVWVELVTVLVMVVVRLEDHSVYHWNVVWLVAGALLGALAVLCTAMAFYYPIRSWCDETRHRLEQEGVGMHMETAASMELAGRGEKPTTLNI